MNYSKTPVAELRALAAQKGIVNAAAMKKKELAELLEQIDMMMQSKTDADASDKSEMNSAKKEASVNPRRNSINKTNSESPKKISENTDDPEKQNRKSVKKNDSDPGTRDRKTAGRNRKNAAASNKSDINPSVNQENIESEKSIDALTDKRNDAISDKRQDKKQYYSDDTSYNEPAASVDAGEDSIPDETYQDEAEEIQEKDYITGGILEILPEGYGFLRSDNYMPGAKDIYLAPTQIRKFRLKTGDIVSGPVKKNNSANDKYSGLLYIDKVNGVSPEEVRNRIPFEELTPVFPDERIHLDYDNAPRAIRIVDFFSPIGKGQRGMIVSPPKAGKTTLLKQIAKRITSAYPEMNLLVLLIDERPEEVTDIKEAIEGPNAEVIYSTFDELPEHHKRVSEMVIERAKRLVEMKKDVVILIDSITRLARAYNLTVTASGRTLSGGLDPAALHMPKKFFGAARNMREGGSLTILATALIETGSRMDDVVFEEFKGTGNMELVLDRSLSEKRIFPAINIPKSGTRRDDLLLSKDEKEALDLIHSNFRGNKTDEIVEELLKLFSQTKNNNEFIEMVRKIFKKY